MIDGEELDESEAVVEYEAEFEEEVMLRWFVLSLEGGTTVCLNVKAMPSTLAIACIWSSRVRIL